MEEDINVVPIAQNGNALFLLINEKDASAYTSDAKSQNAVLVDIKGKKFTVGNANALKSSNGLAEIKKDQIPQIFTLLFQSFSEQDVNDKLLKPLAKK
jgi:hypothetical protein